MECFLIVSSPAYVLELQDKFPLSSVARPLSSQDGDWKNHALKLEQKLKDLQEKHDHNRIGTLMGERLLFMTSLFLRTSCSAHCSRGGNCR